MSSKLEQIAVRLEPELREQLQAEATKDRRPLASLIRNILSDAIAKRSSEQRSAA